MIKKRDVYKENSIVYTMSCISVTHSHSNFTIIYLYLCMYYIIKTKH